MKDKDQKFTVISNKKVIKRFAAIADSNISDSSEKIDEPKNTSYKSGIMRYLEPGNLIFDVYLSELDKLNVDINYGDYVGYQESETKTRFYTVTNDGKVVSDTKHNMFGYKPYYRTITCSVVQDQQFRGV